MDPVTLALATVVVVLLAASAGLTAAETAIFSIGHSRLRTLADEGFSGAAALARLRGRAGSFQPAVHLLLSLLNLLAVGLAVLTGVLAGGTRGAVIALALVGVALVVGAEMLPRAMASRHPVRLALSSAPLLQVVERWTRLLFAPALRLEDFLSRGNGEEEVTPEERMVLEMAELGRQEGVVDADEHLLVERAFRLDELSAWDVMTPRVDVFAWKDDTPLEAIVGELGSVPYSRVPVYGESVDDITGILYVREAYETYVSGRRDVPLSRLSRDPFFVPGSMSLARLLRAFQVRRIHLGIVADEFGGTDGLVTLEDVLEELVGEIVDETDVEDESLVRVGRNELLADGTVDLREINYAFNVSLPQLEHRSLNGFLLDELGRVPDTGESVRRSGVEIHVVEATDTQVVRARLRKVPVGGEVPDAGEVHDGGPTPAAADGEGGPETEPDEGRSPGA